MPVRPTGTPGRGASTVLDSTLLVPSRRVTCTFGTWPHQVLSHRRTVSPRDERAPIADAAPESRRRWPCADGVEWPVACGGPRRGGGHGACTPLLRVRCLPCRRREPRAHHRRLRHAAAAARLGGRQCGALPKRGTRVIGRRGGGSALAAALPRPSCGNSLDSAVRWAIGVHNVSLVKEELCSFTLTATIGTTKPASRASFSPASAGARRASGGPAPSGPRTVASHRGPRPQPPQPPTAAARWTT